MSFKYLSLSVSLVLFALLLLAPPGSLADGPTGDDGALNMLEEEGVPAEAAVLNLVAAYCPPEIDPVYPSYIPGQTYWGRNGYIEYVAGNMPIIVSAPHGGSLEPEEIPDRTGDVMKEGDPYSIEYAREVIDYIHQRTGRRPHLVINHLSRVKMDANREIVEAAQGNPYAEQAWYEYHSFIQDAKDRVTADWGTGHYFDFHINIHSGEWTEFGLGLSPAVLALSDQELDTAWYRAISHLAHLVVDNYDIYFPEVVRGWTSLGGYMEQYGYKTVPSPSHPDPDGAEMYWTGYNTYCHGPNIGGTINSTQVETHLSFVQPGVRDAYSYALAQTILGFLTTHYGFNSWDYDQRVYLPVILSSN